MLGIIGIGAAGGNIADEGAKRGIKSIALNYSSKDIESLQNVNDKLVFQGSEGVGKDRSLAIDLMQNNYETAINFVKEHMNTPSVEVIIVCFSGGGGTGSGSSPLLIDILRNELPEKIFVAAPIIPNLSEVIVNQLNTLSVFEELEDMDICILPIDNEKVKQQYSINSKSKLYEKANTEFVDLLIKTLSYTNKSSKNGIVDKKDLLQVFNTPGIGIISETTIGDISNITISEDEFTKKIKQSWEQSIFANIEYEQILRSSIIFDGQESLMQYLNFESLFDEFNNMPIDLFEGNYENRGSCKVISVLTGLSWITTRLQMIDKEIERKKEGVELDNSNKNKTKNRFKEFNSMIRKTNNTKTNVSDILSKYKR
jgi:cell division GTPase FtsZ